MNAIITKLRKLGVELNLVDNKLRASAPNGVLTSELLEEIKQHKASLISYISSVTAKADVISLQPAPLQECYSLSSAARRMYFLYELDKCSLRYNMLQVIKLKGQPDKDRIAGTFNQLLQRHEALRTYFELAEGVPVQRIASDLSLDITLCEGIEDFRKPFDLAVPPLVRVGLVNLPGDENLLMVDMHHIITDGVSQEILIKDFIRLYAGETLPPLKLHYKDYSEWQQRRMASPEMKGHGEFWMSVFKRGVPVLELPADFARTPQQADEGGVCSFALDHASTARLRQLAADNGATMFMVMLAVYNILLGRLGNQEDVVTGTPVTGRTHPDLEHIIGMFVNMLPVRNYPLGALTFEAFLADVKQNVLSCLEHEEYQYEQLTDDLKIDRSLQRNPLFDTVFTYENDDVAVLEIPGLKLSAYDTGHTIAKFDLTLSVKEMTDHLRLNVEYNARLFRQSTIKEFIGCFREIINTVIACPSIRLADIPLLSAEAGSSLLLSLDHSQVGYPSEATVHRLFERQATLH
ncbi:HxxPF-repeated domain-containing protein, partial [Chitinophaga eiseniae]